jgi:sulfatase maturation enzyme AslB (radical SAM superfamily)
MLVYRRCLRPRRIDRYIAFARKKLRLSATTAVRLSSESARKRLWHRPFPTSVNALLGNQCNLRCGHCPYHGPTAADYFSSPVSMDRYVVRRLMEELPRYQTNAKFGGFEEPLLYDSFSLIADHLIRHGVGVHLTTNGTLITPQLVPLLQGLSTLYVSLDANTGETYRKIRGGNLSEVVSKVLSVSQGFKGKRIGVSFIRAPLSLSEERDFLAFWLTKVDMVIIYPLLRFDTQGYSIDQPFVSTPSQRIVCSSPWLETYVLPNGDVSLCCQTLLMTGRQEIPIMGNIKSQTLEQIWNGEAYQQYRNALLEGDWSVATMCRNCPLWAASYCQVQWQGDLQITCNITTKVIEKVATRHS